MLKKLNKGKCLGLSRLLWVMVCFFFASTSGQRLHAASVIPSEYRFTKKVDVGELQGQLVAAGFAVNFIECSGSNCIIHLKAGEKKSPAPVIDKYVYVDRTKLRADNLEIIRGLVVKYDAGALSQGEKDDLLRRLVRHATGF